MARLHPIWARCGATALTVPVFLCAPLLALAAPQGTSTPAESRLAARIQQALESERTLLVGLYVRYESAATTAEALAIQAEIDRVKISTQEEVLTLCLEEARAKGTTEAVARLETALESLRRDATTAAAPQEPAAGQDPAARR